MMPDLPKIPAIWEHYQHHRTEHGENTLSFVEFLVDHFTGTDHQEADHATLPLHSVGGFAGASGGVYVGVDSETDVQPYFAELTRTTHAQPDAKPYSQTYSKIWEPPRS